MLDILWRDGNLPHNADCLKNQDVNSWFPESRKRGWGNLLYFLYSLCVMEQVHHVALWKSPLTFRREFVKRIAHILPYRFRKITYPNVSSNPLHAQIRHILFLLLQYCLNQLETSIEWKILNLAFQNRKRNENLTTKSHFFVYSKVVGFRSWILHGVALPGRVGWAAPWRCRRRENPSRPK